MSVENHHFTHYLGIEVVEITPEKITAKMPVHKHLTNPNGILHGGAVMSLGDSLGGIGTMANLPAGASTSTIESKTNFFAAIPVGEIAYAECTPLHRGRTTMVWQTKISRADGRLAALVTQTQIVLTPAAQSRSQ
jgi:1,4-dihydroxy-2-naphthoyl-CoA hydrolase